MAHQRDNAGYLDAPVLVGEGLVGHGYGGSGDDWGSPIAWMARAGRAAARAAGDEAGWLGALDAVLLVRMMGDSWPSRGLAPWDNPPESLARLLGTPKRGVRLYGATGGDSPQRLMNEAARLVASGEARAVLVAGGERLDAQARAARLGRELGWGEPCDIAPDSLGAESAGNTAAEMACGMAWPITAYPLLESALMATRGETPAQARVRIGRLFAPFSKVAATMQGAWFPKAWTAQELAEPSQDNRLIGSPYVKRMNAVMGVDQASAVIMTTARFARAMGVADSQMVWMHGAASAHDVWHISERVRLDASPAIRACARAACDMAGVDLARLDMFDLYSCFPVAVEVAKQEIGITDDDVRPLTTTGGLPFFGGAGNAYALMALVATAAALRATKAASGKEAWALTTANGWHLTKHAAGVYATEPRAEAFPSDVSVQSEVDDAAVVCPVVEAPEGRARVVAWTVAHARDGARRGVFLAETETGGRFVARAPDNVGLLDALAAPDARWVGRMGVAQTGERGRASFVPEGWEAA